MFASASSQSLLRLHSLHSTHPMPHSLTLSPFPAATSSSFHRHHYAVQPLTLRSVTRRLKPAIITACDRSNQIGGNGSNGTKGLSWLEPILKFARSNVLPLGGSPLTLVSAVTLGLTYPSLGCAADKINLSKVGPFGIFVISGLMLRSEEIGAAVEAWPVGLFGLVSILFLTPYFSRIILQIQLQPQEFITGLAIFSCMPTTLSSGVALTQFSHFAFAACWGNSALALAMTVISNLLGIMIVLRESFKGVADFVDKNRKLFSLISALFLSLVPWIQVSRSRPLLLMVKPNVFLVAIGLGTYVWHMS
ncbi:hypothetical protein ACSQ67_015668 [Phaseolus vulgaris]